MHRENKVLKYIEEAKKARKKLSTKLVIEISDLDFQIALGEVLGYNENDSTYVMDHELTSEQMLDKLENYEFNFPMEIGTIEFTGSILPDGMIRRLDEEEIKNNGEIWVIHKYDKDTLPSNPHAHNKATGYKLHLGNGDLYSSKNKFLDKKISKKHLLEIRNKVKGITLPELLI